jgi:hypothetical protein
VAHFQRAMMMDVDQAAQAMRDEEMNAEIEDFIEGFNQPTYRGMRVNGQRVATLVIPAMGGPGTGGLRSPRLSADTSISRAETLRVAARKSRIFGCGLSGVSQSFFRTRASRGSRR